MENHGLTKLENARAVGRAEALGVIHSLIQRFLASELFENFSAAELEAAKAVLNGLLVESGRILGVELRGSVTMDSVSMPSVQINVPAFLRSLDNIKVFGKTEL